MSNGQELAARLATASRDVYVAFVDLLGFSERVKKDWSEAAQVYAAIMADAAAAYAHHTPLWGQMKERSELATMQTLSDSIVIVGRDIIEVGSLAQAVQSAALIAGNMLVRGGIAFGRHSEVPSPPHSYVVSRPLAAAAGLEATLANYPRIILDRDSPVEAQARELSRKGNGLFMECEDGLWMIQPFAFRLEGVPSRLEGPSRSDRFAPARSILERLAEAHRGTRHSPKYDWMLSRVDVVTAYLDELAGHPHNPENLEGR